VGNAAREKAEVPAVAAVAAPPVVRHPPAWGGKQPQPHQAKAGPVHLSRAAKVLPVAKPRRGVPVVAAVAAVAVASVAVAAVAVAAVAVVAVAVVDLGEAVVALGLCRRATTV